MAIRLARIFGIQLPVNFASPYKATSMSWPMNDLSLLAIVVMAGVASMYEAEFPQFLYWSF